MACAHNNERTHALAHLACRSDGVNQMLGDLRAQHRNGLLERFPIELLHAPDDGRGHVDVRSRAHDESFGEEDERTG